MYMYTYVYIYIYIYSYVCLCVCIYIYVYAGALMADSSQRKNIEKALKPFQGLLLGLFFLTVGSSLDVDLLSHCLPAVGASSIYLSLFLYAIKYIYIYIYVFMYISLSL